MTPKETKRILLALIPLGVLIGLLSLDIAIFGADSSSAGKSAGSSSPPALSPYAFRYSEGVIPVWVLKNL